MVSGISVYLVHSRSADNKKVSVAAVHSARADTIVKYERIQQVGIKDAEGTPLNHPGKFDMLSQCKTE